MSRAWIIATLAWLAACGPSTLPEYEAARKAALAPPPPVAKDWKPDAVLLLSAPMIERMLTATLPVYGKIDDPFTLESGIAVEPKLDITGASVTASRTCEACLAVDVTVQGTVATAGVVRLEVPVDMTVGVDLAVEGKTVKSAHIVTVTPKDVRKVALNSARLPSTLRAALEEPLTAAIRTRLIDGAKPVEAARFPAEGLPMAAVRAMGSRNGVRVELLTAANSPTPLTARVDKIRDGWVFAVQQDSLTDLARAEAMRQGVVYYDVVPEPTGLRFGRGTFELDLRLWKTTGQGWWRDYTVHGTLARKGDQFEMAPERVVEGAASPGATTADLLAELGRSQIIDNIEAGIAGSLAAKHAADLEGGLSAQVEVESVYGSEGTLMVTGDVVIAAKPKNRTGR